ncbi:hypothetical protein SCUP234_05029 [Seiridium cupressi]
MLGAMNSLTDKPNWHVKIFDDEIVAKWRKEALGMPLMNEKAWDWCLTELRDEAKDFETTGRTLVLDTASRVSKSDTLVDEALRARLISATGPFRNVPDAQKDWHPNSNEQVLNLVHPSLYPLVHGKTQVLSQGGHVSLENIDSYQGVQIYSEIPDGDRTKWSHRFQWLPCEVRFEEASAKDVHITSYISNLHPRHKELYSTIEKIISLSIEPHMLRSLNPTSRTGPITVPGKRSASKNENPKAYQEALKKFQEYLALPNAENYDPSDDDENYDVPMDSVELLEEYGLSWAVEKKWRRMRNIIHPDAGVGYIYDQWKNGQYRATTTTLISARILGRGPPGIVKLSSIELTPEKPTYGGGNWHIEGMVNKHIVATAIYYYNVDNMIMLHSPKSFDVESRELGDEPAVQTLGSVSTPQGRLVASPNTLQHKVEPFELVDKIKPGHRRFLVLWLVDPYYRIASTRNVPPQQHDWWAPEGYDKIDFSAFPSEILSMVTDQVGEWPMGLETAGKLRLELMSERTRGQQAIDQRFQEYNFCEH